ncbi:hypothetical protein K469DRAFT_281292 [Zopfia rhizophila CBS 207.26]|uniref:Uncharacterized protein n=1 Tax=Zopfia rhizophila CBS 207.26 TaxID=1314779 RepID=A0A6A6EPR2_9PEZI|nr:hypothetical protein K469DRAFT_281292 [Zopfia rhizophila CBS 207.26]
MQFSKAINVAFLSLLATTLAAPLDVMSTRRDLPVVDTDNTQPEKTISLINVPAFPFGYEEAKA